MISNLSSSSARLTDTVRSAPSRAATETAAPEPQDQLAPAEPGWLRHTGAVLAATGAGSAGFVWGAGRGLVQGAREIPATTVAGFHKGSELAGYATRGAAAVVSSLGIAGAASVITAEAVLGTGAGWANGTVQGAISQGGPVLRRAIDTGARIGSQVGSAVLGAVGGALGGAVGLLTLPTILYPPVGLKLIPQAVKAGLTQGYALGQKAGDGVGKVGGAVVGGTLASIPAVALGLPEGVRQGADQARQGWTQMKTIPGLSGEIWEAGQTTAKLVSQWTGGPAGGIAGAVTGLVMTGVQGVGGGLEQGLDWGGQAYRAVLEH